jgi:calcineurin-like phosphoesterase family protein
MELIKDLITSKGKVYIISDTHFSHANIIKYCDRPYNDVNTMNDKIVENWNSVVTNEDTVIHLGDVGLGRDETVVSMLHKLNGDKILIKGNHDHKKRVKLFKNLNLFNHVFSESINYYNADIILSHRPIDLGQFAEGIINIHGHIHNSSMNSLYPDYINTHNNYNASLEMIGYKPILLDDILKEMERYETNI